MHVMIGVVLLFVFMLLTGLAATMDLFSRVGEHDSFVLLDVITILAALASFTYFIFNYKFFIVTTMIACVLIAVCAVLNGLFSKNFHLGHHIIRLLVILLIFALCIL